MSDALLSRRTMIAGAGIAAAAASPAGAAPRARAPRIRSEEHWATKGDVRLYLYRKQLSGGRRDKPVLFLVHGSSFSGRGGFDLQVPGHSGYSMMEDFARHGYDVWTMDHEGYGRSTRAGRYADVASGADDLKAAFDVVAQVTGNRAPMIYAQSGGALRAGLFAMREPARIERLILDGFTYTGDGAPEIMRRRARVSSLRASPYRMADEATFTGIFSRDDASTVEPAVVTALARYELALGNRIPNGTYLDMASNLPIVDPAKVKMPVLMLRAEADGNATDAELLEFFGKLPHPDKQFAFVSGVAHVSVLGKKRERVFHVMRSFLSFPH